MMAEDPISSVQPASDKESQVQLHLARAQGDAFGDAVCHMTNVVADGGAQLRGGDYWVGYAIEAAEGMYAWTDGKLVWQEPPDESIQIEITVRDAADGRFVPGARVLVTLIDPSRREVATHEHPLLWHPLLYHYGRNWMVPADGLYGLHVRVEPPTFVRRDHANGRRFAEPAEVEFEEVKIDRGEG